MADRIPAAHSITSYEVPVVTQGPYEYTPRRRAPIRPQNHRREWPMSEGPVAEQFEEIGQQHEADRLGMWIFLATEVMFFGGLLAGYTVYRLLYPEVFEAASHHLDVLFGTMDTTVLLCSSLTMALAVRSIQLGQEIAGLAAAGRHRPARDRLSLPAWVRVLPRMDGAPRARSHVSI